MAAQLASFGSSAKLKPIPNQQASTQQQTFQNQPGNFAGYAAGFPQMNQGFRQPMATSQMVFQSPMNMQQPTQPQYGIPGQFNNMSTGNNFFMPSQGNMQQPMQFPQMNAMTPLQSSTFQSQPVSQLPYSIQATVPHQAPMGMFGTFNNNNKSLTAADANDPFSNLRSSLSLQQGLGTPLSKPTSHAQPANNFLSFDSKPFKPDIKPAQKPGVMHSGFGNLSGFSTASPSTSNVTNMTSTNADNSVGTSSNISAPATLSSFSPAAFSGFSPSLSSNAGQNLATSGIFDSVSSNVKKATSFDSKLSQPNVQLGSISSSTNLPISQFSSSFDAAFTSNPTPSSAQPLDLFGSAPFSNSLTTVPTMQSPSVDIVSDPVKKETPQSSLGFDAMFGPSPNSASELQINSQQQFVKPDNASNVHFNAFDDNFNDPSTISQKTLTSGSFVDDFGQKPFENRASEARKLSTQPSVTSALGVFEQPAPTVEADSNSLDMFTDGKSSIIPADPVQLHRTHMMAENTFQPNSADIYSVFSELKDPDSTPTPELTNFVAFSKIENTPATPAAPFEPVAPVEAFTQSNMFDDAFDPFNTKKSSTSTVNFTDIAREKAVEFDMFEQLSGRNASKQPVTMSQPVNTAQFSEAGSSMVRKRPTAKMVSCLLIIIFYKVQYSS